jgi:PRTRC genetic system protein B
MNAAFGKSNQQYTLKSAFLVYHHLEGMVDVRMHEVDTSGDEPVLGPGQFVTESYLRAIADLFIKREARYLPAHVLAVDHTSTIWFEPAMKRRLFFNNTENKKVKAFSGRLVPMPALVFRADYRHSNQLSVFALTQNERPDADTTLAIAPLWNLDGHGLLCTGSTPLPKASAIEDTSAWSTAFFASAFTHPDYGAGRLHTPSMTYERLLGAAIEKGAFDSAWLVQSNFTLQHLIAGS